MDIRKTCGNIAEREIWLYGAQEEVKAFLEKYKSVLKIRGVITEYVDEVKVQPYTAWDIQAEMMEDAVFSKGHLIVVCHPDRFRVLRWRLLYFGKREYEDFISSKLVEGLLFDKQLIVGMGTQLISQVCILLENSREISDQYSIVYYAESNLMEPYADQRQEYLHVARCCGVHISSDCEKEKYGPKRAGSSILSKTCRRIKVADYGFAGYFPQVERNRDQISDHLLRGYDRLNMSYETVAFAREDKEILRLCREGKSEEDIVQAVGDIGFYSQESVNAHFDSEVERFKQLEMKADIKLGGFIEAHRGELLCRNLNEWHEPAVSYVADEILKRLDLPVLSTDRQERERLLEETAGSDLLIYPSVKKTLGIPTEQQTDRYRIVTYTDVKYMTRDEYVRYTVQYLYKVIDLLEFTGMDKTLSSVV